MENEINKISLEKPAHQQSALKQKAEGGNDQHDWNKNPDDSDCSQQREEDMRTSFGFTDNFASGTEFSGRFNIESNQKSEAKHNKDFKPLTGNLQKTVHGKSDRKEAP
jgi:hypothetical protein